MTTGMKVGAAGGLGWGARPDDRKPMPALATTTTPRAETHLLIEATIGLPAPARFQWRQACDTFCCSRATRKPSTR